MKKWCNTCRHWKCVTHFSKHRGTRDGRQAACKVCYARYREKNKERIRTKDRDYQRRNLLRIQLRRRGLTKDEFDMLVKKQRGLCAICKKPPMSGRWKKLVIDHCHRRQRVRGLLCDRCNRGLGFLGDSAVRLKAALNYLKRA